MNYNYNQNDFYFMSLAIEEAKIALLEDEIPVGAVLVRTEEVIESEHNRTIQTSNPLAHAEKLIIERFISSGNKFLLDCTLYVTLEPCLMCAGLIILSRLKRIVFATSDTKAGCVGSIYNVLKDNHFNHQPQVLSGVMAVEASALLKTFFKAKRKI